MLKGMGSMFTGRASRCLCRGLWQQGFMERGQMSNITALAHRDVIQASYFHRAGQ